MKLKHIIGKIRKAIMVGNSKRKLKKVFKKARQADHIDLTDDFGLYARRDNILADLSDEFKDSLKNRYTGLFSGNGVGKYLDYTNPTDLRIQFLGKKFYGFKNEEERQKLLEETLPDRRTHYETKIDKEVGKIRMSLIKKKDEVKKIAFDKGHAWKHETALKVIKDREGSSEITLNELAGIDTTDLNKNSFA